MEEFGEKFGELGKSDIEVFVEMFNELSPEDREHVINVLENVSKEALKTSEALGKEGIGAAKEVLVKAVESIQISFKTVSDNRTARILNRQKGAVATELARIAAEKGVKDKEWDTIARLAGLSTQNGGSDEPRKILETYLQNQREFQNAEIEKQRLILQQKRVCLDAIKDAIHIFSRAPIFLKGFSFLGGIGGASILPMLMQSDNKDAKSLAKAYRVVRDFPVNDFPQLAPYIKMVDMCLSSNSKLLPMAIELTEGEVQKVRDSLG